uniref:mitogen-activated protein kinase kinase n=1 Tax=Acrobeloides nanus TaxID=290746 RepID=A0A914DKG3_9BILA
MSAASVGDQEDTEDKSTDDKNQIKYHNEEYPLDQHKKDFKFIKLIYGNGFGTKSIMKYFYKPLNRDIAVKCMISKREIGIKIKNEAATHWKLRHSSQIVGMLGVTVIRNAENWETWICMELMDLSLNDVFNWRAKTGKMMPNSVLCAIATNVVLGLAELKDHQIIHRDIKPENIFVNFTGQVKLGDFGDAKIFDSFNDMSTITGTHVYWSLERFKNGDDQHGYDDTSDIWSLGVILMQLITGERPYSELGKHCYNFLQVQEKVEALEMHAWTKLTTVFFQYVQEDELKEELFYFILSCLKPKQDRPNCNQLLVEKSSCFNFHDKFSDKVFRQKCVKKYVQDIQIDMLKKEDDEGIGTINTIPSLDQTYVPERVDLNEITKTITSHRSQIEYFLKKATDLQKREQELAEKETNLAEEKEKLNSQKVEFEKIQSDITQKQKENSQKEIDLQKLDHQLKEKEANLSKIEEILTLHQVEIEESRIELTVQRQNFEEQRTQWEARANSLTENRLRPLRQSEDSQMENLPLRLYASIQPFPYRLLPVAIIQPSNPSMANLPPEVVEEMCRLRRGNLELRSDIAR